MNLEPYLQLGLGTEPVSSTETLLSVESPWQWNIETIMDNTFDYLMPTSMSRTRSYSLPPFTYDNLFDQSLKALESDTCSEFSEHSLNVRRGSYDRIRQFRSSSVDHGRQRHDSDLEEYVLPWEHNFKIGESFDKSLQAFLEWPASDPVDKVTIDIDDGFRIRRKNYSEKKRIKTVKSKNTKSHVRAKRNIEEEVFQDGETADDESSGFFPRFHNSKTGVKKYFSPLDTSEKVKNTTKKYRLKSEMESDSDYKTYSDTSSDKIMENSIDVDIDNLKGLMSSVFDKVEKVTKKLKEVNTCDGNFTEEQFTGSRSDQFRFDAQDHKNRSFDASFHSGNLNRNSRAEKVDKLKFSGISNAGESGLRSRYICRSLSDSGTPTKGNERANIKTNYNIPTVVVTDYDSEADSDSESFVSFIQRLVRSLGRKEGELEGFKDLLKRAEESLSQSETAVEVSLNLLYTNELFHIA